MVWPLRGFVAAGSQVSFCRFFTLGRFSVAPSEEEENEIQRLIDEASGASKPSSSGEVVDGLTKAASEIEWDLTSKKGMRQSAKALLEVLRKNPKQLNLPDGDDEAFKRVGSFVMLHRDKTIDEFIPLIIDELGFKEEKEAKAAKIEAALESGSKNPENAPVIAAIQELADLYFKEGNAVRSLQFIVWLCASSCSTC